MTLLDSATPEVKAAVADTLSRAEGRLVLFLILDRAGTFADPFKLANGSDPIFLASNVGMANLGRELLALIDAVDPQAHTKMVGDCLRAEERRRAVTLDAASDGG